MSFSCKSNSSYLEGFYTRTPSEIEVQGKAKQFTYALLRLNTHSHKRNMREDKLRNVSIFPINNLVVSGMMTFIDTQREDNWSNRKL